MNQVTLPSELGQNIALLLSLTFVYGLVRGPLLKHSPAGIQSPVMGALFAGVAIVGMLVPVNVAPGVIIDGRVIVVALAGPFGGVGAAVTAGALVSAYRLWLAGTGALPGVGAILTAMLLGAWVQWRWGGRVRHFRPKHFLLLGAALAVSGLLWTLTLPNAALAWHLVRAFVVPVGLGYPLGTLFLGTLLSHESRRQEAEEALRKSHDELEQRVEERTAEISQFNALLKVEITERKRAAETVRESEERYRVLVEESPDMIGILAGRRLVYLNPAGLRLFGADRPEQILHKPVADYMHPGDLPVVNERLRQAAEAGLPNPLVELRILRLDGAMVHIEGVSTPLVYQGQPAVQFICRDITERKRAEEALRESEARFRVLTESIPHLIWSARADGTSDYYNRRFLNYLGKTQEDMQGWTWATTLHPDDRQRSIAAWTEAFGRGTEYQIEYRIRRTADGEYRWHFGQAVPLRDVAGKIVRWFGTCTDIHDRKLAEESLRRSEDRFSTAFHASPVAIAITRFSDDRFVDVNEAWQDMLGFSREQAIGRTPIELYSWVNPGARECLIGELHTKGTVRDFHFQVRQKSGAVSDMLMSAELIELAGERCMLSMAQDITERKRAEEALRAAKTLLERTFASLDQAVFVVEPRTRTILDCNPAVARIFGYTQDEVIGRSTEFLHVDRTRYEAFGRALFAALDTRGVFATEYQMRRKDGTVFVSENTVTETLDGAGQRTAVVSVVRDITERKRAEEALRESEERFRKVFEEGSLGMVMASVTDGRFIGANAAFCQMLGYVEEEMKRLTFVDVTHPDHRPGDVEAVKRLWEGQIPRYATEKRYLKKNGETLWGALTASLIRSEDGKPLYSLAMIEDITERKQAEGALLARTRQLEAVRAVTTEITRELDLQILLELIVRRALELLGAASGTVYLWDEGTQILAPQAWHNMGEGVRQIHRRSGEGVAGRVVQRRAGLIVNDYRTSPYAHPDGLRRPGVTAVIAEPLLYRGRLVGVIGLDNEGTGRHFTPQDGELLGLFANQAAIAIENARLFGSVREQHDQLRVLAARLAEAEEAERRRLSQELHDWVGQSLTALGISLSVARLEDALGLLGEAVERTRDVMSDLRPPVLDDYGLAAALRWHGERFAERTGLAVLLEGNDPSPRLAASVETALFRIAQEALTNVAKHARARRVTLTLEAAEGTSRLSIADDGAGFDPKAPHPPGGPQGWGLLTMRERAEAVGGTLTVESAPGQGTRIIVEVRGGD